MIAATARLRIDPSRPSPFRCRNELRRITPTIRLCVCSGCRLRIASQHPRQSEPDRRCSRENLLRYESRESMAKEFRQSQRADCRTAQASRDECIRTRGGQLGWVGVADHERFAPKLECQSAHRWRPYESPRSDTTRLRRDTCRRPRRLERSKLLGHQSLGTANTYFDAAVRRSDSKKVDTQVREILGTMFRLTASSAISRRVNCETGRSDSSSGSSQAMATMAACCWGENFDPRPLRG